MGEISQPTDPPSILQAGEDDQAHVLSSELQRPLPVVDAIWQGNYGDVQTTKLWFAIVEDYSATWFNGHHSLDEIRPRERNGMALSPNGEERSASTGYHMTPDGERYTDFSTHGCLPDGHHDSGDALELAMKVWDRSKSSILAETTREIISKARAEMEAAARNGELPPSWVCELMTPAGWRRYDDLRASTSQSPAGESLARDVVEQPAQTDQAQPSFQVGDLVVWNQELRGGYGTIWPVDGEVVKVSKAKIAIRVQKRDGTLKEIAVKPESLVPRPGAQLAGLEDQTTPVGGISDLPDAQGSAISDDGQDAQGQCQERELIECYHLQRSEPCGTCSCELQRDLAGSWVCCRCLPAKGYHLYSDQVDVLYPRRRRLEL